MSLDTTPIDKAFDREFFQYAPNDQWIQSIDHKQQLVLSHLHRKHRILRTCLPDMQPRLRYGANEDEPKEVELVADTLWIDTDRELVTVTWRCQLSIERPDAAGVLLVGMETQGVARWPSIARIRAELMGDEASDIVDQTTAMSASDAKVARILETTHTSLNTSIGGEQGPAWLSRPLSPTAPKAAPPAGRNQPSHPHSAHPASAHPASKRPAPAPPAPAPPGPAPAISATTPPASPAPALPAPAPGMPSPRLAPPLPTSTQPRMRSSTLRGISSPAGSNWFGAGQPSNVKPPDPISAQRTPAREEKKRKPEKKREAAPQASSSSPALHLLWFDKENCARVPKWPPFAKVLASAKKKPTKAKQAAPKRGQVPAPPPQPESSGSKQDRLKRQVARVLRKAGSTPHKELPNVLTSNLRENAKLDAPLVVVSGQLLLLLDAQEQLKQTVASVKPMATSDKRLEQAITQAELTADSPLGKSVGIAENMTAQLHEAWRSGGRRPFSEDQLKQQVERLLLEERKYRSYKLLGGEWLHAQLVGGDGQPEAGGGVVAYLPKSIANELPLSRKLKVHMLVEVIPSQDETLPGYSATKVIALAREVETS